MVYVGPKMKPEQQALYDALHRNGVMCMISVAPTHDRAKTEAEKIAGYQSEIGTCPDVIETDYPYLFQGLDLTKQYGLKDSLQPIKIFLLFTPIQLTSISGKMLDKCS